VIEHLLCCLASRATAVTDDERVFIDRLPVKFALDDSPAGIAAGLL